MNPASSPPGSAIVNPDVLSQKKLPFNALIRSMIHRVVIEERSPGYLVARIQWCDERERTMAEDLGPPRARDMDLMTNAG